MLFLSSSDQIKPIEKELFREWHIHRCTSWGCGTPRRTTSPARPRTETRSSPSSSRWAASWSGPSWSSWPAGCWRPRTDPPSRCPPRRSRSPWSPGRSSSHSPSARCSPWRPAASPESPPGRCSLHSPHGNVWAPRWWGSTFCELWCLGDRLSATPASPSVNSPPATTSQAGTSLHLPPRLHHNKEAGKTGQISIGAQHIMHWGCVRHVQVPPRGETAFLVRDGRLQQKWSKEQQSTRNTLRARRAMSEARRSLRAGTQWHTLYSCERTKSTTGNSIYTGPLCAFLGALPALAAGLFVFVQTSGGGEEGKKREANNDFLVSSYF